MHVELLALDLDGTVLDPKGRIRPRVANAIRAASERGVEVVLCTGRRMVRTLPFLEALDLQGPAVVQNGVVVKEPAQGRTLHSAYLEPELYRDCLELVLPHATPLVYIDDASAQQIATLEQGKLHDCQVEYLNDNREFIRIVSSLEHPPVRELVMLSVMAPEAALQPLVERVERELGERVRTHFIENKVYRGHILEVLSPAAGKWRGLSWVAAQKGIAPDAIIAIGDDQNDAEMLAAAGLGLAMANGRESAKAVADAIVPGNDEDGVAVAIERYVLD